MNGLWPARLGAWAHSTARVYLLGLTPPPPPPPPPPTQRFPPFASPPPPPPSVPKRGVAWAWYETAGGLEARGLRDCNFNPFFPVTRTDRTFLQNKFLMAMDRHRQRQETLDLSGLRTFSRRKNRTSVGDEYGAGNPEVLQGAHGQISRTGGKRDFSPCVYRGLGERSTRVREYSTRVREYASTRVREYASMRVREKSLWTLDYGTVVLLCLWLHDTIKAGNGNYSTIKYCISCLPKIQQTKTNYGKTN